jgi:hypothetical protein
MGVSPVHVRTESYTFIRVFFNTGRWEKSKNPVIPITDSIIRRYIVWTTDK